MEKSTSNYNVLLLGNFTKDTKILNQFPKKTTGATGGSVAYAGAWFTKFRPNISGAIISNGIPQKKTFSFANLKIYDLSKKSKKKKENLTHFKLIYQDFDRKLFLVSGSDNLIKIPDINQYSIKPDIIFFLPVYHELSLSLIEELRMQFPNAFFSCDPQGWLRSQDPVTGQISAQTWAPLKSFLDSINVLKMSKDDLQVTNYDELCKLIKHLLSSQIFLIITAGENGAIIWSPSGNNESVHHCFHIPAVILPSSTVIDLTGAGDVFIVSFTVLYYETKDIFHALANSAVITALLIQAEGLSFKSISNNDLNELIKQQKQYIKKINNWQQDIKLIFNLPDIV
ncbi:MAG: PfkB family carbohydrate kinase [Candidatus Hodarchaeales archaeon]|jgi:hypothetical protein